MNWIKNHFFSVLVSLLVCSIITACSVLVFYRTRTKVSNLKRFANSTLTTEKPETTTFFELLYTTSLSEFSLQEKRKEKLCRQTCLLNLNWFFIKRESGHSQGCARDFKKTKISNIESRIFWKKPKSRISNLGYFEKSENLEYRISDILKKTKTRISDIFKNLEKTRIYYLAIWTLTNDFRLR